MKTTSNAYKPNYNRLLIALNTSSGFYDFVFHLGYQQFVVPRWLRKFLAKTKLHRSWFSGFTGLGILSIIEITRAEEEHPGFLLDGDSVG